MTENSWEPTYGFCEFNTTANEVLARTLEALRRRVCAYGGGDRCDCKYGLSVEDTLEHTQFGLKDKKIVGSGYDPELKKHVPRPVGMGSEQTGCPELRELINRLLHRPETLSDGNAYDLGYTEGSRNMRSTINNALAQFRD